MIINANIMQSNKVSLPGSILLSIAFALIANCLKAQPAELSLQIDETKTFQTMDGFGVNINPAWWYNGRYEDSKVVQPAIDLLVDSLGANIFRVVIEEIDWEAVNDDDNPDHFNWDYYNKVFSGARFQGVWNTLRYLNQKGISNHLVISLMGAPPASTPMAAPDPLKSWMGGTDNTIAANMEDEMAESIAALLYYMRNTAKIQFSLVSPMNETDIQSGTKNADHPDGIVEGPNIPDAVQYVRIVRTLAEKLDAIGMGDIRFVAPDAAGDKLFGECLGEIVRDPYLLKKMAHWGIHNYGNDSGQFRKLINRQDNPISSYWVTETAGISNLLGQLDDDARAFIFWDGYDCVYQHGRRNGYGSIPPNDWVFWEDEEGKPLIEFNAASKTWTPRKQFYEHAHIMRFVKPGAVRTDISGQDSSLSVYAYRNPDGNMVILGRNNLKQTITFNAGFSRLQELKDLKLYYTDSTNNFSKGNKIITSGKSFKALIPAESVFTITGMDIVPSSSYKRVKR